MNGETRRESGREMAGFVIILIGFGLLLNTMGIVPFGEVVARFWLPAVFVGVGLFQLARSHGREGRFMGWFFLGLGVLILLNTLNLFAPFSFRLRQLIAPAILIFIGMRLLIRAADRRGGGGNAGSAGFQGTARVSINTSGTASDPSVDSSDFIDATAVLGGFNRKSSSQQLRGGDVTAIMGGGKLDLRDAKIQGNEAVLDVFTIMGGMEIMVPHDWVIEQRFTPILGGYEDKTRQDGQPGAKKLAIKGVTIMGGVVVTN
jgi:predicted membrane protein